MLEYTFLYLDDKNAMCRVGEGVLTKEGGLLVLSVAMEWAMLLWSGLIRRGLEGTRRLNWQNVVVMSCICSA